MVVLFLRASSLFLELKLLDRLCCCCCCLGLGVAPTAVAGPTSPLLLLAAAESKEALLVRPLCPSRFFPPLPPPVAPLPPPALMRNFPLRRHSLMYSRSRREMHREVGLDWSMNLSKISFASAAISSLPASHCTLLLLLPRSFDVAAGTGEENRGRPSLPLLLFLLLLVLLLLAPPCRSALNCRGVVPKGVSATGLGMGEL
mmetsp:Transcript_40770/g.65551  ORF Transcript_40770/g.65551 Transcript_40770/m.65551 type:complete len:201 (+) Transcript_40770:237-839(+)